MAIEISEAYLTSAIEDSGATHLHRYRKLISWWVDSKLLRSQNGCMIVGTTQAAQILKISTARLRILLIAGRVKGAYKTGKIWLMPLFKGKPIIEPGSRGPAPRWRNPPKPAKTIIHVNSHRIRQNHKKQERQPTIAVKKGRTNMYGHEVEIPGGCRVVYRPESPAFGARVWIETLYDVRVVDLGNLTDQPDRIPEGASSTRSSEFQKENKI